MELYRRRALVVASLCGILFFAIDAGLSNAFARDTAVVVPRPGALPAAVADPFPPPMSSAVTPDFATYIDDASLQYGVSRELIRAVIETESEFDPLAISSQGACGLMQLMPRTARSFGVVDCFDARQNIEGGTRYLKLLLTRYEGSLVMSVAAYHAGETAVARHGGIPPFPETRAYVRKITSMLVAGSKSRVSLPVSRNRQS